MKIDSYYELKITPGMWIDEACERAWMLATTDPRFADGTGEKVETEFNDWPLVAYATDAHPQVVLVRYQYEKRIQSFKAGYLKLSELSLLEQT